MTDSSTTLSPVSADVCVPPFELKLTIITRLAKYVHFLIGSMQDNLIDKSGWALDGDLTIDITPLSPILAPNLRKAPDAVKSDLMERMIAIELNFENLDLTNKD